MRRLSSDTRDALEREITNLEYDKTTIDSRIEAIRNLLALDSLRQPRPGPARGVDLRPLRLHEQWWYLHPLRRPRPEGDAMSAPTARELPQVPDGSICTACEHSVADHDLQRATNLPPTLCRKCAIKGDICGGGVFRGPDKPLPTARELLRVGYEGEDVEPRLLVLAARVEAVLALALESRRKAMAGDGYGLIHAHEVLMLLDGGKP